MRPSSIHPSLSSEDEEVKRKLVKCSPWTYSELIRSDIPRPSCEKSSQPSALRPSQSSVMKPSQEELQARVEFLVKKKRSAKCKVQAAPENIHVARSWGRPPRHRLFGSEGRRGNSGREVTRLILWPRCQR